MKKEYEGLKAEVILFNQEDVVATSGASCVGYDYTNLIKDCKEQATPRNQLD